MSSLVVLFEHASGYGLFRVKEFEEVSMLLPQVEASVSDVASFKSLVQLMAFTPFKNAANALDNINSISEGILHEDLHLFLETHVPKPGKKEKVTLGVADAKIGAAVLEALSIPCQHTGVVPEIIRGIRVHFAKMVKGLTDQATSKAQLGLGHSYSRAKVKFNVNRVDNMIIQSISLLDQLDKDINTFAMRIREWYSYHFPELIKIVPDNYNYSRAAKFIGNCKALTGEKVEELGQLLEDPEKAQAIVEAARSSMGMDISDVDLMNIETFATRVISLVEYRKQLMEYLKGRMHSVAPNLAALIGETVGARLISHAGSLTNLAKYPASTVQILGAEKALFRALKTRSNTPKYGLIFHSTFIGRAATKNKGRISRYLANKCSIASRIDCFSEIQTDIFGTKLREQVEERLKFYDTGDFPRKNLEVMKDACQAAAEEAEGIAKKKKKKAKKEKKRRMMEHNSTLTDSSFANGVVDGTLDEDDQEQKQKKKKKKKVKNDNDLDDSQQIDQETYELDGQEGKKKKKRKREESENLEQAIEVELSPKKIKKKKKKAIEMEDNSD